MAAAALLISVCALVVTAVSAYPAWKLWRIDRAKAKAVREGNVCTWCGLPNASPQEELARPCPRNPNGEVGHHWQVSVRDVGARVSGR